MATAWSNVRRVVGYGIETIIQEVFVCRYVGSNRGSRTSLCLDSGTSTKMKIQTILLAAVLILGSTVLNLRSAPPQFFIQGSTSFERNRLIQMEQTLNFTKVPMTDTWEVVIDPGDQFRANVQSMMDHHAIDHFTDTAYTSLLLQQTHVNEDYLVTGEYDQIRHTMAHEAGHLICECHSEEKANDIAYVLETSR